MKKIKKIETSSHSILDTRFKTSYWKSYLEDFVRSVYCLYLLWGYNPFGHYAFGSYVWRSSASASGAFGFCGSFGLLASVPASIVYFILLALGQALRRIKTFLSNLLKIIALIWFFIIPLTVLYVLIFS